jgi:hypothetical protein
MEIDFSGLWSWTVPLWSLFLLILFLGGVLLQPTVLKGVETVAAVATTVPVTLGGGGSRKKQVRFNLP